MRSLWARRTRWGGAGRAGGVAGRVGDGAAGGGGTIVGGECPPVVRTGNPPGADAPAVWRACVPE